jgi:phage shock protein PspC (stress-responsive transcriptional regulator)
MSTPLGFQRVKVIALSVIDPGRANQFYSVTLGLPPAFEGTEQVGFLLGQTILMLKANWYAPPTDAPNPRVTIAADHAPDTEKALRERGVVISDPVQLFDDFHVGSFLDSEGNKLWFCSPASTQQTGMTGAPSASYMDKASSFLSGLTKSKTDVVLGGVCGGFGKHTPIPSWVWRVGFLVAALVFGTGVLVYVILWIALPDEPKPT